MPLGAPILDRLRVLFAPADQPVAVDMLESADIDAAAGGAKTSDRIRIAALKVSGGDLDRLVDALIVARTDWRDLLVAADFAHDTEAHLNWWPDSTRDSN